MRENDCIFCKIVDGELDAVTLYQDDKCIAFADLSPQAPVHILVVPRDHIESLNTAAETDSELLGHLLVTAAEIARSKGIAEDGYRVVINTNSDGGQTIFHLHIHLLGGRPFAFPPG
ncbi:MAG: histidine triad nucleotide-binding protein [Pyrinomonadaceae bacterium]